MKRFIFITLFTVVANVSFSQNLPDTTHEYYFIRATPNDSDLFYKNIYHYNDEGSIDYITNTVRSGGWLSGNYGVPTGRYTIHYQYDEKGQITCKFMINTTNKDTMCKEIFISKGKDLEYVYQIPDKKGMRNYYRYYYHNIRDKESIPLLNELLSMFNLYRAHDFYLADSIDIDYYDTSNSQYVVHNKIYFEYLSNNLLQKCIQKEYISNNIKTMDMVYDSENNYVGIEVSISIPDSCSDNYMNLSQSVNDDKQLTEILLMPYYNSCSNIPDYHGTKVTYLYNENKDLELEIMYLGDDLGNWNVYMKRYYTYNTSRIASVKEADIQVFPNPATTQLTLDNKDALIKEVHIYDITGGEVRRHSINANQSTLDISTLKSGLYIVKIHTEQGVLNRKVQVVK